jgi:AAA family ATP:ADP antiporter
LAVALLSLFINWVNTNGENILYGAVQHALEEQYVEKGLTEPGEINRHIKAGTTAFFGNLYFWVNLGGLLLQAFVVSRLLRFGGLALIMMLTPLISMLSYGFMALFPVLAVIRIMKIAENSSNYSINNTARQVIWLPTSPTMVYKAKAATDTLFARLGDGLAALTVMVGVQILHLPMKGFIFFNLSLVSIWGTVAWFVIKENRRLTARKGG